MDNVEIKPENLTFFNTPKIFGINVPEITEYGIKHHTTVKFKFGAFNKPKSFNSKDLNIILDHSYTIDKNDRVIVIDHHLVEELDGIGFKSNADMMVSNYNWLFKYMQQIIEYNTSNIVVWMHADIDGLCSGLIMKKLLMDVKNGEMDPNYKTNLMMVNIIGNYGDLYPDSKLDLTTLFGKESEILTFDKKMSGFCRSLSRFMKATRSVYDDLYENLSYTDIVKQMNSRVDCSKILEFLELIDNMIRNMSDIDIKKTLYFFNILSQNTTLNVVLEEYNNEIAKIINNYIEPTTPSFDMTIVFKKDPTATKYKLLIIDSPFDCGRSIIWKYRANLAIFLKKCGPAMQWKYRASDWTKDRELIDIATNCMCYNRMLGKLSIDGVNESAYNIAKDIFDGGGHARTDDGRSLGSVVIEDEDFFFNSFILVDFF